MRQTGPLLSLKAVEAWIDNHLGPTVQSQRGVLQAIFSDESVTKVE